LEPKLDDEFQKTTSGEAPTEPAGPQEEPTEEVSSAVQTNQDMDETPSNQAQDSSSVINKTRKELEDLDDLDIE